MRKLLIVLTLWLPLPATAQESTTPAWDFDQLMRERAQVQSARARFVEVRTTPAAESVEKSSGTLSFQAPDRLERRTTAPVAERALVEGDRLALEFGTAPGMPSSRREFALADVPGIGPFLRALRAVLAGDTDTLRQHFKIDLQGNADAWKLKLVPRDAGERNLRDVVITGGGHEISTLDMRQRNGDTLHSALTPESVELKKPAEITAPAGVN